MEITVEEQIIKQNHREIYGKLYYLKKEGKHPIVIMSHGFNGCHGNFPYECGALAENGYMVFVYDFCGGSVHAKSSGKTTDMTIFTEKEDLRAVIDYVCSLERVDTDRIYLMGASQGGLVTALVAEEVEDLIRGMILYFPALNIPDDWRRRFKSEDEIPESVDLWGMKLGRNFFLKIREFDTFEHIGGFKKSVLIIHGDRDEIVIVDNSKRAERLYRDLRLEVLQGEGHGFSPKGTEKATELMLEFLQEH